MMATQGKGLLSVRSVLVCAVGLSTAQAMAAGLYFSERGTRPLARGGAYVAGANDLGSMAYNPAGLASAGNQALADFGYLRTDVTYTRQQKSADGFEDQSYQTVHGRSPFLPIPTLGLSGSLGLKDRGLNFAFGVYTPYMSLLNWPEDKSTEKSPQRFSLISLDGSVLALPGVYTAYKAGAFQMGAGVQMLVGKMVSTIDVNGGSAFGLPPESDSYVVRTRLETDTIREFTWNAGVIWAPVDFVKIGASYQHMTHIRVGAQMGMEFPDSPLLRSAEMKDNSATFEMNLPSVARAGVEFKMDESTHLELAGVWERWSVHRNISVLPNSPSIAALQGADGAGTQIHLKDRIDILRAFRDTWSVRLGGEKGLTLSSGDVATLRAGVMYERSAVEPRYVNARAVDADKIPLSVGGGWSPKGGAWSVDAVYSYIYTRSIRVSAQEAAVPQLDPVYGGSDTAEPRYINGGDYKISSHVFGLGTSWNF